MTAVRVRECGSPEEVGSPQAWDALVARPPASLCCSYTWCAAAFAAAHPDAEPFVLAVDAGERLIGVLPLALHRHASGPVLRFAGAPHNDMTDVMVLPGHEEHVREAIVAALEAAAARGWSVSLEDIDPHGVLAGGDREGWPGTWSVDDPAPVVALARWRSAAAPRRIAAWERALERLRRRHDVRFRCAEADDARRALPDFMRLRRARLAATGREELPPHAFLQEAVERLAGSGGCAIMEMLIDGELAASDVYLAQRPTAMLWVRGLDPRWSRHPCGHLLLRASGEHFRRAGFETLDFGRGDEPYKALFGADRRALLRLDVPARAPTATQPRLAEPAR